MTRLRPYTEDKLSEIFFGHLRQHGIRACHIPNEGKRNAAHAAKMKRLGLVKGPPDYLVICITKVVLAGPEIHVVENRPAKLLGIEVKAIGKRPTHAQQDWLESIGRSGNGAYWIRGYTGVRSALACFGIAIAA